MEERQNNKIDREEEGEREVKYETKTNAQIQTVLRGRQS